MQIDSHGVMAMCQWLIRYQRANGYHATIYLSIILCCPTFDPEKSWRMPQDNWIRLGDEDGWGMRP
uniref:Uncharacterized protein n=1 Tax=Oryza sativa subsp. japonica TaxID=39947 RepID=Q8W5I8_ORYSJ|nr:hypothetical protein [Oryza sativa Japonica Group]